MAKSQMKTLLLTTVLFLVWVKPVFACSCGTIPFNEALESSTEIFIGTVVKIELVRDLFPSKPAEHVPFMRQYYWIAEFEVSKKWKGNKKSKIIIAQTFNSCEFRFNFDNEYLVFATESGSFSWNGTRNHTTWLCSRTMNTRYFQEWAHEDWVWDDRDSLDIKFPEPVQTAAFFNNWPIWSLLFGLSLISFINFIRRRNAT